jgi:hypothetical protein
MLEVTAEKTLPNAWLVQSGLFRFAFVTDDADVVAEIACGFQALHSGVPARFRIVNCYNFFERHTFPLFLAAFLTFQ